jgi:cytochrome c-type biogenesis protein CcmH
LLLGRSYAQLGQQPEARAAYVRALDLQVSSEALLGVAEADIMQDRNSVVGPAGQLVEQALSLEPENPKALFYGGMVAMARNEPDVVRARWGRLIELSPPPNLKKILEEQLAMLPGAPVAQPSVTLSEEGSGTISVDITLSPSLSEKIKPGAMLFLVARDPARPGPPVAAVRRSVVTLPTTIKISDSDAMLPGRSISGLSSVTLVARIANSGDPIAKPGDLFGETAYQNDGANPSSSITIDKIVE